MSTSVISVVGKWRRLRTGNLSALFSTSSIYHSGLRAMPSCPSPESTSCLTKEGVPSASEETPSAGSSLPINPAKPTKRTRRPKQSKAKMQTQCSSSTNKESSLEQAMGTLSLKTAPQSSKPRE